MKSHLRLIFTLMVVPFLYSCSVISTEVKTEAGPRVDFGHIMEFTDGYLGQTVILGGYIIDTDNREEITLITVLHSPLDMTDSPVAKDSSQGRFIVVCDGFLDPAVYAKNRRVTVAGVVERPEFRQIGSKKVKYLKLRSREIYLHTQRRPGYYDYGYYDHDYFFRGYPRHSFHYRWHFYGCCP
ncbi:MAG: hypothetical protein GY737_00445 [Desulfobacteraceae bacterium]|nr:hypothetical protein [Desulfobacteraceae bacterium]